MTGITGRNEPNRSLSMASCQDEIGNSVRKIVTDLIRSVRVRSTLD